MKRMVILPVLALLCVSTITFAAESGSRDQLLRQGLQAIKQKDFEKVPAIIRQLRMQGAARQAKALEESLNKARIVKAEEAQGDFAMLLDENRDLRVEVANIKAERDILKDTVASAERGMVEVDLMLQGAVKKYKDYNDQLDVLKEKLANQADECRKQLEERDSTGQIANLNKIIKELEAENRSLGDELMKIKDQLVDANVANEKLKGDVKTLHATFKSQFNQLKQTEEKVSALQGKVDSLLQEKNKIEQDLFARNSVIEGLKEENQRLENEIQALKRKNIQQSHGLQSGVK